MDSDFIISVSKTTLQIGEQIKISSSKAGVSFELVGGEDYASIEGNTILALNPGSFQLRGILDNRLSNTLSLTIEEKDPYATLSKEEFYKNYRPAISSSDAKYRSLHSFLSGSLTPQKDIPTIVINPPMEEGKYVRNTTALYSEEKQAYTVLNFKGEEEYKIYKEGAYITLSEVAAYVFAFGDAPKNTIASKNINAPATNPWGEYLRLNNTYYSSDTTKYPYEPLLPNAYNTNNQSGTIRYYEMDIGTTGTSVGYNPGIYNNGKEVNRGTARLVYSKLNEDNQAITNTKDRFVFYTYNHYNDFQEYLNYHDGWGKRFGKVSAGGKMNSSSGPNPTPYEEVIRKSF